MPLLLLLLLLLRLWPPLLMLWHLLLLPALLLCSCLRCCCAPACDAVVLLPAFQLHLVTEFIPNGTLRNHILNEAEDLPWDLRLDGRGVMVTLTH